MRRAAALLLVSWAVMAAPAVAAGPTLTPVNDAPFPNRAFVLSLPAAKRIDASNVRVRENGRPVSSLSVLPATIAGSRELGVVLVIDTSGSMRGKPIQAAMAAARAFAAHRNPQQQLAVITFNGSVRTRLPFSADPSVIDQALSTTPRLGRNTHIYDALSAAAGLLRSARISGGSIVLLSDGRDTGSAQTQASAIAATQAAGARVFTVGLRSGAFDPTALAAIGSAGHGSFSEATSSADLARIYDQLGSRLASDYVIRYRSLAGPHRRVNVAVDVGPSSTFSAYTTPALPVHPPPPFHRPFWQRSVAIVVVSLCCALLVGIALLLTIRSRPPRQGVRARMAAFVTSPASRTRPRVSELVLRRAERVLERREWWAQFKEEVDVARLNLSPERIVFLTIAGTIFTMWLLALVSGSVLISVLGLGVPVLVRIAVVARADRERRLFSDQLADNLQVIASAMRAGQSLIGAMSTALNEAPEPTRREFMRVVEDEQLGVTLDDALGVVARRMKNRDLEQVQVVAALQRETGGNSAEILERVADTIRERQELRRLVRTLTAQGRLSRWVLTGLPFVLLLLILSINRHYLQPLLHTTAGHLLMVLSVLMVAAGSYVIKRIVDIKV